MVRLTRAHADERGGVAAAPRRGPAAVTAPRAPRARSRGKTYPATKPGVARARGDLTEWLSTGGANELLVADVAVAVAEACTNVVVHAYGDDTAIADAPLRLFRVTARRAGEAITVTVADTGGGIPPHHDGAGIGLGLPVIAALTNHVEVRSGADGHGTVVSMLFTPAGGRTRTPERPVP